SAIGISEPSKHWSFFNYRNKPRPDVDTNDRLRSLGYAIAPSLAVEILRGVIDTSVKPLGHRAIDGVRTTGYAARVAPDAAVRDLQDERRRNGILRMFQTIGATQKAFPVRVWIDDHGLARRIVFTL